MIPSRSLSRQSGASLISMLFLAVVVAFVMLMGARVFPSVNEYLTIRKAVNRIMAGNPASPTDIRTAFDKTVEVEYSIQNVHGKDLDIRPVGADSGNFRCSYAYNVEIPIIEPVFLLVKYAGSAKSGGGKGP